MMSRVSRAFLLIVVVVAQAAAQEPASESLRSYSRARQVLDAGVKAIGGLETLRSIRTIRRNLVGDWFGSGQSRRPLPAVTSTLKLPDSNSHNEGFSFIDYAGNRWLDEVYESDETGDAITRINAVGLESGFETITFKSEKPFYRAFSPQDLTALRVRKFRRYPEGLLLMAVGRPETLAWVGPARAFGRSQRVISFADPLGTRVLLYFDAQTNLLTKSEILRAHSLAGDSYSETIYSDYRKVGPLRLPFRHIERVAGVPTENMNATSIDLNVSLSDERFRSPAAVSVAKMIEDPSDPTVKKLGDNIYLIRASYNIVFAEFRDYLVVLEAPINSAYSETCLRLIRSTVPNKPIRYVVATHFHYDHIGGLRPYIADGIQILTTQDAKPLIERLAATRRTMYPDILSRKPVAPRIETVIDRMILDDGANRLELHEIGPTQHVAEMLVGYFPKERVLFQADLWDPISSDLSIGGSDASTLDKRIRERGLLVERIIPVHGLPATSEMLRDGLEVRAKYLSPRP